MIGMSGTHLYKLLDRNVVPHYRVGTHRRIRLKDLLEFAEERDADRRELAERFKDQAGTLKRAVGEIADLL